MIHDQLRDIISQHLGVIKRTRKGWQQRNCMMCPSRGESADTRGRLGIMLKPTGEIACHCFNCNFKAKFRPGELLSLNMKQFMRELGISQSDIKKINFGLFREQNAAAFADPALQLKGLITDKWKTEPLPKGSLTMLEWLENGCNDKTFLRAVNYAISRGFSNLQDLYWTPEKWKMFHMRMILPFKYKGNIVGYTGRFCGSPPSKEVTKYLNILPDDFIYNFDTQYDFDREYVILCEGVFDAYFTDGISPSGNTLNEDQISLIRSLGKKIIVCPDKDKSGGVLVDVAIANGWYVAFPDWGYHIKDATEAVEKYGRILTVKSIIDSKEKNPTTIQLKWKLSKNERN